MEAWHYRFLHKANQISTLTFLMRFSSWPLQGRDQSKPRLSKSFAQGPGRVTQTFMCILLLAVITESGCPADACPLFISKCGPLQVGLNVVLPIGAWGRQFVLIAPWALSRKDTGARHTLWGSKGERKNCTGHNVVKPSYWGEVVKSCPPLNGMTIYPERAYEKIYLACLFPADSLPFGKEHSAQQALPVFAEYRTHNCICLE